MAGMRAFVAVVPPAASLTPLVVAVSALRGPGASWVPPERLHLTLAFLGEVSDHVAARVADRLGEAVRDVAPFSLRIAGGGAFPRPARPRVLWAGVAGDVDALASLARVVRRAARSAGADVERAPYVPHVTVARVRARDYDGTAAVATLADVAGEPWAVTEVVLLCSTLGPRPSYDPLAVARLTGPGTPAGRDSPP
jgi:2'-5' RNA ligase